MTERVDSQFQIPEDWPNAAMFFCDLRDKPPISKAQWESIVEWLVRTEFDASNFIAGEAAASLVRERAPELVADLVAKLPSDEWHRHMRNVLLSDRDLTQSYVRLVRQPAPIG